MRAFKSIIVLDTETTSLPIFDQNTTKITELALLGCEVEHLLKTGRLPRVLHKMVLLFNPLKVVHPTAANVSGLCNVLLVNTKPFTKQDVDAMRSFIDRLPQPVCIIAHNGNRFDYPILRSALDSVQSKLQDYVYCVDSLLAFKELLPEPRNTYQFPLAQSTNKVVAPQNQKPPPVKTPSTTVQRPLSIEELLDRETVEEFLRQKNPFADVLSRMDSNQPARPPAATVQPPSAVEDLFSDDFECSEELERFLDKVTREEEMRRRPKSYKLADVYEFLFGLSIKGIHRAEGDCMALLRCVIVCEGFFNWMNKNAVLFNDIKPLPKK